MRKLTAIGTIVAGITLSTIALTGCSGSPTDSPTTSPSATVAVGGVKEPSGKCVDGMSSPTANGKTYELADCDTIDVLGSKNTITAGTSKQLSIEGSGNTITVDTATKVTTLGKDNVILYTGDEPEFTELGSGNKVMPESAAKD